MKIMATRKRGTKQKEVMQVKLTVLESPHWLLTDNKCLHFLLSAVLNLISLFATVLGLDI